MFQCIGSAIITVAIEAPDRSVGGVCAFVEELVELWDKALLSYLMGFGMKRTAIRMVGSKSIYSFSIS